MSARAIYVDEIVTGGSGVLDDPFTGWADELMDRLAYIGVGAGINGTTVIFGVGAYDTEGGLTFDGQQVHLEGMGGPGTLGSSNWISTLLINTDDAPAFYFVNDGSYLSSVERLAIIGDYEPPDFILPPSVAPTETSQTAFKISNGGVILDSIGVTRIGGNMIEISGFGSDSSRISRIHGTAIGGHGVYINRGNFNHFRSMFIGGCYGNGIDLQDGVIGNYFDGIDIEKCAGYAIKLHYVSGTAVPRDNQLLRIWDEGNTLGCLKIDGNCRHNHVDFSSYSSIAPDVAVGTLNANRWSGRDRNSDDNQRIDGFTNVRLRHLETQDNGGTPSLSGGSALGSGGSAVLLQGRDSAMLVRMTTGAGATTGTLATATFALAYTNPPIVVCSPENSDTANDWNKIYIPAIGDTDGPTTTTFTIKARAALADGTHYKLNCMVVGAN
jgi:hypothetical protein